MKKVASKRSGSRAIKTPDADAFDFTDLRRRVLKTMAQLAMEGNCTAARVYLLGTQKYLQFLNKDQHDVGEMTLGQYRKEFAEILAHFEGFPNEMPMSLADEELQRREEIRVIGG